MNKFPSVVYEWDIETLDEHGDIQNHHHENKLKDYPKQSFPLKSNQKLVLVRDDYKDNSRTWAYVQDKKLPEFFSDAYGVLITRVPQKFHTELSKYEHSTN